MPKIRTFAFGLTGLVVLSACGNLPRGAGLQSEVLRGQSQTQVTSNGAETLPKDFAVEPITKENLGRYANWPARNQTRSYSWLSGQGGQAGLISAGDTIGVTIWVNEENGLLTAPGQRTVVLPPIVVSPSGEVFLPYVGQVKLSGKSLEKARQTVEAAYSSVAPSAQVQLTREQGRQSSVTMVSGVGRTGPLPLTDAGVTVLDALALAGGAMESLKNPQLRVQRGDTTYGIALDRVLKDTRLNVAVRGGDRIFVEPDQRYFLSLGAAGSRAQHQFPQDRVSALDALSIIGGLADARANAQGILVLRAYDPGDVRADGSGPRHPRTIFTIDLTSADGLFSAGEFLIQPGDLVYVTESPLIGARNVLGMIGSVFGLAKQAETL